MRHATHPIPRLLATVALFTIVAGTLTSARSAATAAEDPSDDGPPVPARRDAALIERWGRTALTGPIPDRPAEVIAPPPIPEECLVWATGLDSQHAREALFCAHLGPDGTPPDDPHDPPTPGRWASLSATDPGMWTGDFDHAFLRVTCQPSAIVFARLSGAETLIVNGEPFHGDPERRGLRGGPVQLRDGDNELYIVGATRTSC